MAVLGLVIERPNQTGGWYRGAVAQRFPRARFSPSAAHQALNRLLLRDDGPLIRRTRAVGARSPSAAEHEQVDGGDATVVRGRSAEARYKATPAGYEAFRAWMFQPPTSLPVVRQALYGRIGLARLEDLPRLIRVVREEEAIATHLYEEANAELREQQMRRRNRSDADKTRTDFEREIRETWLHAGPLHWASRATLCLTVLDRLEEIAEDAGVSVEDGPDDNDAESSQQRAG